MATIPETGPGVSGFLAAILWRIYPLFPSSGREDWLLLFLGVALAAHLLFLPHLWESVRADMAYLKDGRAAVGGGKQGTVAALGAVACLAFALCFFSTEAGRTFLQGRHLLRAVEATDAAWWLPWTVSVILLVGAWTTLSVLERKIDSRNRAMAAVSPYPYQRRTGADLYAGGGIFVNLKQGKPTIQHVMSATWFELLAGIVAHLFCLAGPIACLVLIQCFVLSAAVMDGIRMLFVAVNHKATFG